MRNSMLRAGSMAALRSAIVLDRDCTLDGANDAAKLGPDTIAGGIDDATAWSPIIAKMTAW